MAIRQMVLAGLVACAPAAHAAYAGVWFQCQPRWAAEKNYLLVTVRPGERAWDATWGVDSAQGRAERDKDGNLQLRGCHVRDGRPSTHCNPAQPPLFATLPKGVADGKGLPADAALRRGGWIRTDGKAWEPLARQCAALRTKG